VQTSPAAQAVGPVHPIPPHWPYSVWVGAGALDVVVVECTVDVVVECEDVDVVCEDVDVVCEDEDVVCEDEDTVEVDAGFELVVADEPEIQEL